MRHGHDVFARFPRFPVFILKPIELITSTQISTSQTELRNAYDMYGAYGSAFIYQQ